MQKAHIPLHPVEHPTRRAATQGENSRPHPFKAVTFLATHPLFRDLGPAPLGRIAAASQVIEIARGKVLFKRDDPCSGFHIIVYGRIKLSVQTARGYEKVIELLGTGQSFGEAVMFVETPCQVSAEAIADSKLLHIDRAAVCAEIDRAPPLARRFITSLSKRLNDLVSELETQALQSGTQRVAGYLLSLVDEVDCVNAHIELPAQKNIIASRLNLTHEHFSRILHGLADAGVISIQGQKIVIPDLAALHKHID